MDGTEQDSFKSGQGKLICQFSVCKCSRSFLLFCLCSILKDLWLLYTLSVSDRCQHQCWPSFWLFPYSHRYGHLMPMCLALPGAPAIWNDVLVSYLVHRSSCPTSRRPFAWHLPSPTTTCNRSAYKGSPPCGSVGVGTCKARRRKEKSSGVTGKRRGSWSKKWFCHK